MYTDSPDDKPEFGPDSLETSVSSQNTPYYPQVGYSQGQNLYGSLYSNYQGNCFQYGNNTGVYMMPPIGYNQQQHNWHGCQQSYPTGNVGQMLQSHAPIGKPFHSWKHQGHEETSCMSRERGPWSGHHRGREAWHKQRARVQQPACQSHASQKQTSQANTRQTRIPETSKPGQQLDTPIEKGLPQNVTSDPKEFLAFLHSKGYTNMESNTTLLKHFSDDKQAVFKCLTDSDSDRARRQLLSQYQENFLILSQLGYCKTIYHWKVLKALQKSQNNLQLAMKHLDRRLKIQDMDREIKIEVGDCEIEMLTDIPEGCQFLIDGFNAVRAIKQFRNLTNCEDQKSKLEAVIRLKTLVETLAPGNLVLDKRFLDDTAQKEIVKKIGVELPSQKLVKVVYADSNLKADDKIVEILRGKTSEQRLNILLVTSDRKLIKECQEVCGTKLQVIGGQVFIKNCKKMLPQGVKNRVIRGSKE